MISDVLPSIVIYLNRKFNIDIEVGISAVKKSEVLRECTVESENDMSTQEWLGKFMAEVGLGFEMSEEEAKVKVRGFIDDDSLEGYDEL